MSLDEKDMDYLKKLFFNDDGTLKQELPPPNMYPFIEKALMNIALGNPAVYAMGLKFSNIGARQYINQLELRDFKNKDDKKKVEKSINKLKKTIKMTNYVIAKLMKKAEGKSCPNYPKKTPEGPEIQDITDEEFEKIKSADTGKKLDLKPSSVKGGRGKKRGTKKRRVIKFRKKTRKNRFSQKGGCKYCGNACGFLYSVLADSLGVCLVCNSSCRRYRRGNKREQRARRGTERTAGASDLCCGVTGTEHTFTETQTVSAQSIDEVLSNNTGKDVNALFEQLIISTIRDEQMGKIIERLTNELIVEDPKFNDIIELMIGQKKVELTTKETNRVTKQIIKKREKTVLAGKFIDSIQSTASVTVRNKKIILQLERSLKDIGESIAAKQKEIAEQMGESKSASESVKTLKRELTEMINRSEKIAAAIAKNRTLTQEFSTGGGGGGASKVSDGNKQEGENEEEVEKKLRDESIEELKTVVRGYVRQYIIKVKDAGKQFRAMEADTFQEIFERLELGSKDDSHAANLTAERGNTLLRSVHTGAAKFIEGERPHGAMSSRRFYWKSTITGILKGLLLRTVTQGIQSLDQGGELLSNTDGNLTEEWSESGPRVPDVPQALDMNRGNPEYTVEEIRPYLNNLEGAASTTLRTAPLFLGYLTISSKFYFMLSSLLYILQQFGLAGLSIGPIPIVGSWFAFMLLAQYNGLYDMKGFMDATKTFVQNSRAGPGWTVSPVTCCKYLVDVCCAVPQSCFRKQYDVLDFISADTCCIGAEIINGLLTCNSLSGVFESWNHNGRQVRMSEDMLRQILKGETPTDFQKLSDLRAGQLELSPSRDFLFRWSDLKQEIESQNLDNYFNDRGGRLLNITRAEREALNQRRTAITNEARLQMGETFDAQKMDLRFSQDERDEARLGLEKDGLATQQKQAETQQQQLKAQRDQANAALASVEQQKRAAYEQERQADAQERGNDLIISSSVNLSDGLASVDDIVQRTSLGEMRRQLDQMMSESEKDSSALVEVNPEEEKKLQKLSDALPEVPTTPLESSQKRRPRQLTIGGFKRNKSKRRRKRKKKTRRKKKKKKRKTTRHKKKKKRSSKR